VDSKIFMLGASASGSFVSRFVMLHPEIVKAASVGSPGWGPAVPVGTFNGQPLLNEPGNRASLPVVASAATEGWFPKMESDGWTGLAFVNADSSDANVILTAYGEDGSRVAENHLPPVHPGEKVVGLTFELFNGADLENARYFGFTSDMALIGFTVSRSEDGLKLDGLMALPRYQRVTAEKVR
jgi:hypothetical protein